MEILRVSLPLFLGSLWPGVLVPLGHVYLLKKYFYSMGPFVKKKKKKKKKKNSEEKITL